MSNVMGTKQTNYHANHETSMGRGQRVKLPFLLMEQREKGYLSSFMAVPNAQNKERHPWNCRIPKIYFPKFQNFEEPIFNGWFTWIIDESSAFIFLIS